MTNGCRVWDRENKIWLNLFKLVFSVDGKIMAIETIEAECYGLHQVIIEPSTGQPDKNGVLLFAGDICIHDISGNEYKYNPKEALTIIISFENMIPGFVPTNPELVHEDDRYWRPFYQEYDDDWDTSKFEKIGTIHDADGEAKAHG